MSKTSLVGQYYRFSGALVLRLLLFLTSVRTTFSLLKVPVAFGRLSCSMRSETPLANLLASGRPLALSESSIWRATGVPKQKLRDPPNRPPTGVTILVAWRDVCPAVEESGCVLGSLSLFADRLVQGDAAAAVSASENRKINPFSKKKLKLIYTVQQLQNVGHYILFFRAINTILRHMDIKQLFDIFWVFCCCWLISDLS